MTPGLAERLRCPTCAGPLTCREETYHCEACRIGFPPLGDVTCLLPTPEVWRERWSSQLSRLDAQAQHTAEVFESEARRPGLLPSTRRRLGEQARLARQMIAELRNILAAIPVKRGADTPNEPGGGLETLHLLHRDWGWPESTENDDALALVSQVCADEGLGDVLVLGAGAGRLSSDLAPRARSILALDIDPLAATVAHTVLRGDSVTLTEMRANATELEHLAVTRTLRAPRGGVENVEVMLANGLAPPVRDGSFDTVITPWFIDLVPADLRALLGELRRVLKPGGRWIDFGPLLYPPNRRPSTAYSRDELLELATCAGFEVERAASAMLTYARSPLTERGRLEKCLAFSARKSGEPQRAPSGPAPWIVFPWLSVPDFDGRTAFAHVSSAFRAIVGLIDGRRTIAEIARTLIARTGTDATGVEDSIRFCLLEVHPAAR